MINIDYEPTELYFSVCAINKKIHAIGEHLAACDAKEVYHTKLSTEGVYDMFNEESDKDVIELVTYNFDKIGDECETYYRQSRNKIMLFGLESKQKKLTQMFPLEKDIEQKRKILNEIQIITKEIKKLKSEDNK